MRNRVILALVVHLELAEVGQVVERFDHFHVIQFGHDRVLESHLEQVIITLLGLAIGCGLSFVAAVLFSNSSGVHIQFALLFFLIRFLTAAVDIDLFDVSDNTALNLFEVKCMLKVFIAEALLGDTFLRALPDLTFLLELFHHAHYRLEPLGELSLGINHDLGILPLVLLNVFQERIEGDSVLDEHFLNRGLLRILLNKLALHVLEERP